VTVDGAGTVAEWVTPRKKVVPDNAAVATKPSETGQNCLMRFLLPRKYLVFNTFKPGTTKYSFPISPSKGKIIGSSLIS